MVFDTEKVNPSIYMNTHTHPNKSEFELELAQLIITALNLEVAATSIDPNAPLYGDEGLGIDSIDILELSLAVTKHYGVQLRSDDKGNTVIFASLRNLGQHIQQHRAK